MSQPQLASEYRVEKSRSDAVVTLANGTRASGSFFLASSSARHAGPERIIDVLNAETGFFPFELDGGGDARTILYNRAQVVTVLLAQSGEEQRDPGYAVATRRPVSVLLSSGARLAGVVRVHRPLGRDRLSDWARSTDAFRYLETAGGTLIVNTAHIVEVSETSESIEP